MDINAEVMALLRDIADPYVSWAYPWVPWVQQYQWPLLGVGAATLFGIGMIQGLRQRRQRATSQLATWATVWQIWWAGGFNRFGIYLDVYDLGWYWGPWRYQYLRTPFEQNALVSNPPGTGKSALMLATLLGWDVSDIKEAPSMFVLDMSGDLIKKTVSHRRTLGPVYILDLNALTSDAINPLDYPAIRWGVDGGIHEAEDCQRAAHQLISPDAIEGSKGAEHYERMAQWVLPMGMLYLYHQRVPVNPSPRRLAELFASSQPITATLQAMLEVGTQQDIFLLKAGATMMLKSAPAKRQSDWQAAYEWLLPYADDKLATHTNQTTIPWWEMQQGDRPMTLYLRVKPDDASGRLAATIRLYLDQFLFRWTDRDDPSAYRRELIMILDDLARPGYLRSVEVTAEEKRKYGLRIFVAFQSFKQLHSEKGVYRSLKNSCRCWVIYGQSDYDDAMAMTEQVGHQVVEEKVDRVSTGPMGSQVRHSRGTQARERWMAPPEAIQGMDDASGEAIIVMKHLRIKARRLNVYTDPYFKQRMPA